MTRSAITRKRIDELVRFLPIFNTPGPENEPEWRGLHEGANDGTMPNPVYPPAVQEFFAVASQPCWNDSGYDPETAGSLLRDDRAVARASLAEIKTMLTFCVRGERFCDGHWASMIQEGRIGAILRRLQPLRDELPGA